MIKTLDRYILGAFFWNYVIAIGVMIGMYVLLDLFINLDEFTGASTSTARTIANIIDFYGHNLFLYFAQLAGVITLVAACFTLARLHRANELIAILASGTSLYRVAAPILLAGLAVNAVWFIDQEIIIPDMAPKLARKHGDIEGRNTFGLWFLPEPGQHNAILSAAMFSPRMKEMRGLVVMRRDENYRLTEIIRADQARWDEERQVWHLENGYSLKMGERDSTEAPQGLGREPVVEYASDLTPKEMGLQQASQWTNFLSLPEIEKLQTLFAETGAADFIKVKHTRMTTIIINMILLCLGIPFFLNRERPSVVVVGGQCLLICGICYVFNFFCQSIDMSMVNPALPAWAPVLVFGPIAVVLLDGIKT